MKRLHFICTICLLLLAAVANSQPAERPVQVLITPDHADWLYKPGEQVKLTISVLKNSVLLPSAEVRYELSEDMMEPHKTGTLTLKDGTANLKAGTLKQPGFLRCQAYIKYNGKEYRGITTVGFSPEKIAPTATLPDDFLSFWNNAKAQAAKIPMDTRMTLIPERCTETVNVYHVSLQSYEWGTRLYGILCTPKAPGKYPAILKVPGAGIRPYYGDVERAARGIITFEIGIHGIPVNMPAEVYNSLNQGALRGYPTFNLNDKDKYYYKRVYIGCVRSIDFIYSLPEFDGNNLITLGGSQGGALSIVTAGLDSRVKGLVAFYPALCDLTGYLHRRAGGWPHMFRNGANNQPQKIATSQYYDVVNFARQVKVPGFYTFGYNDMVCPPTSTFSAYNSVNAPKQLLIAENTAHYTYPEQWDAVWEWVYKFFNK